MKRSSLPVLLMLLLCAGVAQGVIETYEFSRPELEQRYRRLSAELRCPKCQNQNIADSNAPISQDLRRQLFQQLEAGASDTEILVYMVSRYGEFVRYRPRFGGVTTVLWLAPALLLVAGVALLLTILRQRKRDDDPVGAAPLAPEEQRRLRELLQRSEQDG